MEQHEDLPRQAGYQGRNQVSDRSGLDPADPCQFLFYSTVCLISLRIKILFCTLLCDLTRRNWDARRSTSTSLEAVAKLIKERPDSFEEKTAKRASVAAAPLAAWVLANLQYGQILEQVAPLEREQRQLAEYALLILLNARTLRFFRHSSPYGVSFYLCHQFSLVLLFNFEISLFIFYLLYYSAS